MKPLAYLRKTLDAFDAYPRWRVTDLGVQAFPAWWWDGRTQAGAARTFHTLDFRGEQRAHVRIELAKADRSWFDVGAKTVMRAGYHSFCDLDDHAEFHRYVNTRAEQRAELRLLASIGEGQNLTALPKRAPHPVARAPKLSRQLATLRMVEECGIRWSNGWIQLLARRVGRPPGYSEPLETVVQVIVSADDDQDNRSWILPSMGLVSREPLPTALRRTWRREARSFGCVPRRQANGTQSLELTERRPAAAARTAQQLLDRGGRVSLSDGRGGGAGATSLQRAGVKSALHWRKPEIVASIQARQHAVRVVVAERVEL